MNSSAQMTTQKERDVSRDSKIPEQQGFYS